MDLDPLVSAELPHGMHLEVVLRWLLKHLPLSTEDKAQWTPDELRRYLQVTRQLTQLATEAALLQDVVLDRKWRQKDSHLAENHRKVEELMKQMQIPREGR